MGFARRPATLLVAAATATQLLFFAAQPVLAEPNCYPSSWGGPERVKQWTSPYTYYYQVQASTVTTCPHARGPSVDVKLMNVSTGVTLMTASQSCPGICTMTIPVWRRCSDGSTLMSYKIGWRYKEDKMDPGPWQYSSTVGLYCRT